MVEDPAPEEVDAFREGIRRWFVEDQGFLDIDALLESLDMTMEELEVVAQQENFPRTQVRGLGWGLWDPADIVKWREGGERNGEEKELRCSFCGKSQGAVQKLIAGPGVYICNECVDLSNEILEEDIPAWHWRSILAPLETRLVPPEPRDASLRNAEEDDDGAVVASPPETDEELDRLWHAFKANRRDSAREQLIMHYAPLVLHAADALGPLERPDLISYGMFGLIDALTKFEPGSGESFETYARPHILEAILEELRLIARADTSGSD